MPQPPFAFAVALAMPLTRRQARMLATQSPIEKRRPDAAAVVRLTTVNMERNGIGALQQQQPGAKGGPAKSEAVKIEPQLGQDPYVKAEHVEVDAKPFASAHLRSAPHATAKRERSIAPDIEDVLFAAPSPELSRTVTGRLRAFYRGESATPSHPKAQPGPLLDSLIATILSQATSNNNSSRAFGNLKSAFASWDTALAAGPGPIEDAIRCGGLAAQKAIVIDGVLRTLQLERGATSLEFLRALDDEEVKRELCRFKGVGPKTAACVLMFGMNRAEFPVDTHVRRISGRLGWMPLGATAERTYEVLNGVVPDEVKELLHVLLIEHGRNVCRAQRPRCGECPLAGVCPAAGVSKVEVKGEDV